MPDKTAAATAAPPAVEPQPPAAAPAATTDAKPKRARAARLTPEQKRAKITDGVEDNLNAAGNLVVLAANGFVNRGDRARARACLEIWDRLISTALPEVPEEPEPTAATA